MSDTNPSQNPADADEEAQDITGILMTMSADLVRLVVLEVRLFGHTVLAMLALTVIMALLLVGGWLFIGAALVVALASLPVFNLAGAMLTVALAHLAIVVLMFWWLRFITRDLTFRESRASVDGLVNHARLVVGAAVQQAVQQQAEQQPAQQPEPQQASRPEQKSAI